MPISPNPDNYTLGRGIAYFNKKTATGYDGERDLGNVPELTFSVSLETLDHFSSRSGLKSKDKKAITQLTPALAFTLDEMTAENFALLTLADLEDVSQSVSAAEADVFTGVVLDRFYTLDRRSVSIRSLAYKASAAPVIFTKNEIVTGAGGASAQILEVEGDANTGTFWIGTVTAGPFIDSEALTGSVAGDALADGVETADVDGVVVSDNQLSPTIYTVGTDYTVDATRGRVKILSTGTIVAASDISVSYSCAVAAYKKIKTFAQTELEGMLRYISDNPLGNNMELEVWRVSLTPSGDTAMIGDDWSSISFDGEILKDEVGHPESPYMSILMD